MGPENYLGSISMFGGDYAPRDYAFCNGQLEAVGANQTLFAVISDRFGGDGRNTFGIPDYRGRVPMHWGSGVGLTPRRLAEKGGFEETKLTAAHMPVHSHKAGFSTTSLNNHIASVPDLANSTVEGSIACSTATGNSPAPQGNFPAISTPGSYDSGFGGEMNNGMFRYGTVTQLTISSQFSDAQIPVEVADAGAGIPFEIMQPYLAVSFCMCTEGLFPPRT